MKRVVPTLTIAALAGALLTTGNVVAASASTVTNGTVHVFDYGDGEGIGSTIVLTGAIGDSGSADSIAANGTPQPNSTEVKISLVQGSFTINVARLDKKIDSAFNNVEPNARTCSAYIAATGSAPIVAGSGTGAYTGITGGFTLTFTFAEIGSRYPSGKHAGQCNNSNNAPSVGQAQFVTGWGTVSF
jgi:hypothetical protein